MKPMLLLMVALFLTGCDRTAIPSDDKASAAEQGQKLPEEYQGDWVFDGVSAGKAVSAMDLPDHEKAELKEIFIEEAKYMSRHVDADGRITSESYPDEMVLRIEVMEKRADGLVTKTINSLNPEAAQYILNRITDGVWRCTLLDESLKPVANTPDDFWKRP